MLFHSIDFLLRLQADLMDGVFLPSWHMSDFVSHSRLSLLSVPMRSSLALPGEGPITVHSRGRGTDQLSLYQITALSQLNEAAVALAFRERKRHRITPLWVSQRLILIWIHFLTLSLTSGSVGGKSIHPSDMLWLLYVSDPVIHNFKSMDNVHLVTRDQNHQPACK